MNSRFGLCFTNSNSNNIKNINWKKNFNMNMALLNTKSSSDNQTKTIPAPVVSIKTFMNLSSLMKYKPCGSCGGAR